MKIMKRMYDAFIAEFALLLDSIWGMITKAAIKLIRLMKRFPRTTSFIMYLALMGFLWMKAIEGGI